MDSMAISPLFRASIYKKPNPEFGFLNSKNNCFSFFKFNCFTKRRNFAAIPVSYRPPSYLNFPRNRCNHRIPTDLFYALMPLIQSIKDFVVVASGIRTGNVLLKDLAEKWVSSLRGCDLWEGVSDDLSGGIGVSLLSVTSTAKVRISPVVATLAANPTFVSGLIAWVIAQLIKIFLNFFMERKWDFRILFASGGMPSSHSALCTALTTSVALCHGVADSLFPVCLGFSLIVMYDAIGVRRHAGMQAEVLNMIIQDLFQGHPISQRKLKEFLGHTPSQCKSKVLFWKMQQFV
ncbi:PREDICTED: uncharacterized protein LOC104604025 isoform X2 [Nelumbo nucifera]|uniref:Uncharacterized protein LOC104604025 isoform X2 n=1 Tax=Nelumbo nucifera TaxID=4432 RepID=A0A1U8AUF7_NELNU|nr:PREDICTED: uncharacterized protein LOC104604025 isoform X2 [Nelumbo nucifera]